jgi:hypothetical protein
MLRIKMEDAIATLSWLPTILDRLREKGYTPGNPALKFQYSKIRSSHTYLKKMVPLLTENDFYRAGGAVQGKPDQRSMDIKKRLLLDMYEAFQHYGPVTLRSMAIYRSIAEILKTLGVKHQQDGDYTLNGVKQILRRPIDTGGRLNIDRWDWAIDQIIGKSK